MSILGSQVVIFRNPCFPPAIGGTRRSLRSHGGGGLVIECSSRPQKKATAHHRKTRPRKTQPWDVNRKPTVYAPLPQLPPEWVFASDDSAAAAAEIAATSTSPQESPATN
ncbi:hypothetical protein UlMin_036083 [Ulmus minor]